MKIFISILFASFLTLSCKKDNNCVIWVTDSWCEPKPGSGAMGCSRSYDMDFQACNENHYENEKVMYHEDAYVKYYRLFKRKK